MEMNSLSLQMFFFAYYLRTAFLHIALSLCVCVNKLNKNVNKK